MSSSDIPAEVVEFLAAHIDSVVRLEVLLLLQSRPGCVLSAADIAAQLRVDSEWVSSTLPKLEAIGMLVRVGPSYRYSPRTPQLDQTVRAVAQAYSDRRVSVISLIFAKPVDPVRQFADAFRFKKG